MATDIRATCVLPAGEWPAGTAADQLTLDYEQRHRRRFRYCAERGTVFLLDLPRAVVIGDGDGLLLEDGRRILVRAAAESLLRVTAADTATLMRLGWHIGNRHLPAVLTADHILIRDDAVIAAMLRGLGAGLASTMAPFTPERGAYAGTPAPHHHHHDHA